GPNTDTPRSSSRIIEPGGRGRKRRNRRSAGARRESGPRPDIMGGMSAMDPVRVGLLGCGHVGSAVARMLLDHAGEVASRAGRRVEVSRVAVRNLSKERDVDLPPEVFTHDPHEIVRGPSVDVIVE